MLRLLIRTVVWLVRAALRSRDDLVLENLALRQQLAIYQDKRPQPRLTDPARAIWVGLRAAWPRWRNALILVEPDRVVKWHRQGFAWFWRWKKRARKVGRPRVSRELRELIRRMALENGWGAPRIHAELSKLGFAVSERTVSRYLPRRPTNPDAVKLWLAFLRNHRDVIAGVDFFSAPTAYRPRRSSCSTSSSQSTTTGAGSCRKPSPITRTPTGSSSSSGRPSPTTPPLVISSSRHLVISSSTGTVSTGISSQRPCGPGG